MRVLDGASLIHHLRACDDRRIDVAHEAILERHHHRYRLYGRAGFVAEHGMIDALHIFLALFAPFEVGDGLDFACGHFHEHTSAPFGIRLHTHFFELLLHDVLQSHIDGGGDVISRHGRLLHHARHTGGYLYVFSHTGLPVEKRVERHFQAASAVYLTVFAFGYVANASRSHSAVRLGAYFNRRGVESALIARQAQERECAQSLHVVVGNFLKQAECAVFACFQFILNASRPLIGAFPRAEVC